ncbi:hypothetical protein, partial [Microcoleus sp. Pol17_C1]|uniref:hypothetical protein n=1 Tax=unclassified Microcoleus TaxID=2642155 RepID=UPI002FD42584
PTQSLMLILLTLSSSYYTKLDELTLEAGRSPVKMFKDSEAEFGSCSSMGMINSFKTWFFW